MLHCSPTTDVSPTSFLGERASLERWHSCMGHPSSRIVRQIISKANLPVSPNKGPEVCATCQFEKSHKLPLSSSLSTSSAPLKLLFSDVWGPTPTRSVDGHKYYVIFVDDYSKFSWLFPLV